MLAKAKGPVFIVLSYIDGNSLHPLKLFEMPDSLLDVI